MNINSVNFNFNFTSIKQHSKIHIDKKNINKHKQNHMEEQVGKLMSHDNSLPLNTQTTYFKGYCTPGPYFLRLCVFSQKTNKQTKRNKKHKATFIQWT